MKETDSNNDLNKTHQDSMSALTDEVDWGTEPEYDAEPDPLDENDHRDRLAYLGAYLGPVKRLTRREKGHWHTEGYKCDDWCRGDDDFSLAWWAGSVVLTFAPEKLDGSYVRTADGRPANEEVDMDEALTLGAEVSERWARTLELLKQAEVEEREQQRNLRGYLP